jgi:hypothetical protein
MQVYKGRIIVSPGNKAIIGFGLPGFGSDIRKQVYFSSLAVIYLAFTCLHGYFNLSPLECEYKAMILFNKHKEARNDVPQANGSAGWFNSFGKSAALCNQIG